MGSKGRKLYPEEEVCLPNAAFSVFKPVSLVDCSSFTEATSEEEVPSWGVLGSYFSVSFLPLIACSGLISSAQRFPPFSLV